MHSAGLFYGVGCTGVGCTKMQVSGSFRQTADLDAGPFVRTAFFRNGEPIYWGSKLQSAPNNMHHDVMALGGRLECRLVAG